MAINNLSKNTKDNCDICCYSTVANVAVGVEPSPLTDFYIQERHSPHSKTPSVKIIDDVHMLFNQQRLDKMTLRTFTEYMQSQVPRSSSLASLRTKMSDAQLHQFVKSRYIQSIGELQSWALYLGAQSETLKGELQQAVKAQAEQAKQTTEKTSEVDVSPEL